MIFFEMDIKIFYSIDIAIYNYSDFLSAAENIVAI